MVLGKRILVLAIIILIAPLFSTQSASVAPVSLPLGLVSGQNVDQSADAGVIPSPNQPPAAAGNHSGMDANATVICTPTTDTATGLSSNQGCEPTDVPATVPPADSGDNGNSTNGEGGVGGTPAGDGTSVTGTTSVGAPDCSLNPNAPGCTASTGDNHKEGKSRKKIALIALGAAAGVTALGGIAAGAVLLAGKKKNRAAVVTAVPVKTEEPVSAVEVRLPKSKKVNIVDEEQKESIIKPENFKKQSKSIGVQTEEKGTQIHHTSHPQSDHKMRRIETSQTVIIKESEKHEPEKEEPAPELSTSKTVHHEVKKTVSVEKESRHQIKRKRKPVAPETESEEEPVIKKKATKKKAEVEDVQEQNEKRVAKNIESAAAQQRPRASPSVIIIEKKKGRSRKHHPSSSESSEYERRHRPRGRRYRSRSSKNSKDSKDRKAQAVVPNIVINNHVAAPPQNGKDGRNGKDGEQKVVIVHEFPNQSHQPFNPGYNVPGYNHPGFNSFNQHPFGHPTHFPTHLDFHPPHMNHQTMSSGLGPITSSLAPTANGPDPASFLYDLQVTVFDNFGSQASAYYHLASPKRLSELDIESHEMTCEAVRSALREMAEVHRDYTHDEHEKVEKYVNIYMNKGKSSQVDRTGFGGKGTDGGFGARGYSYFSDVVNCGTKFGYYKGEKLARVNAIADRNHAKSTLHHVSSNLAPNHQNTQKSKDLDTENKISSITNNYHNTYHNHHYYDHQPKEMQQSDQDKSQEVQRNHQYHEARVHPVIHHQRLSRDIPERRIYKYENSPGTLHHPRLSTQKQLNQHKMPRKAIPRFQINEFKPNEIETHRPLPTNGLHMQITWIITVTGTDAFGNSAQRQKKYLSEAPPTHAIMITQAHSLIKEIEQELRDRRVVKMQSQSAKVNYEYTYRREHDRLPAREKPMKYWHVLYKMASGSEYSQVKFLMESQDRPTADSIFGEGLKRNFVERVKDDLLELTKAWLKEGKKYTNRVANMKTVLKQLTLLEVQSKGILSPEFSRSPMPQPKVAVVTKKEQIKKQIETSPSKVGTEMAYFIASMKLSHKDDKLWSMVKFVANIQMKDLPFQLNDINEAFHDNFRIKNAVTSKMLQLEQAWATHGEVYLEKERKQVPVIINGPITFEQAKKIMDPLVQYSHSSIPTFLSEKAPSGNLENLIHGEVEHKPHHLDHSKKATHQQGVQTSEEAESKSDSHSQKHQGKDHKHPLNQHQEKSEDQEFPPPPSPIIEEDENPLIDYSSHKSSKKQFASKRHLPSSIEQPGNLQTIQEQEELEKEDQEQFVKYRPHLLPASKLDHLPAKDSEHAENHHRHSPENSEEDLERKDSVKDKGKSFTATVTLQGKTPNDQTFGTQIQFEIPGPHEPSLEEMKHFMDQNKKLHQIRPQFSHLAQEYVQHGENIDPRASTMFINIEKQSDGTPKDQICAYNSKISPHRPINSFYAHCKPGNYIPPIKFIYKQNITINLEKSKLMKEKVPQGKQDDDSKPALDKNGKPIEFSSQDQNSKEVNRNIHPQAKKTKAHTPMRYWLASFGMGREGQTAKINFLMERKEKPTDDDIFSEAQKRGFVSQVKKQLFDLTNAQRLAGKNYRQQIYIKKNLIREVSELEAKSQGVISPELIVSNKPNAKAVAITSKENPKHSDKKHSQKDQEQDCFIAALKVSHGPNVWAEAKLIVRRNDGHSIKESDIIEAFEGNADIKHQVLSEIQKLEEHLATHGQVYLAKDRKMIPTLLEGPMKMEKALMKMSPTVQYSHSTMPQYQLQNAPSQYLRHQVNEHIHDESQAAEEESNSGRKVQEESSHPAGQASHSTSHSATQSQKEIDSNKLRHHQKPSNQKTSGKRQSFRTVRFQDDDQNSSVNTLKFRDPNFLPSNEDAHLSTKLRFKDPNFLPKKDENLNITLVKRRDPNFLPQKKTSDQEKIKLKEKRNQYGFNEDYSMANKQGMNPAIKDDLLNVRKNLRRSKKPQDDTSGTHYYPIFYRVRSPDSPMSVTAVLGLKSMNSQLTNDELLRGIAHHHVAKITQTKLARTMAISSNEEIYQMEHFGDDEIEIIVADPISKDQFYGDGRDKVKIEYSQERNQMSIFQHKTHNPRAEIEHYLIFYKEASQFPDFKASVQTYFGMTSKRPPTTAEIDRSYERKGFKKRALAHLKGLQSAYLAQGYQTKLVSSVSEPETPKLISEQDYKQHNLEHAHFIVSEKPIRPLRRSEPGRDIYLVNMLISNNQNMVAKVSFCMKSIREPTSDQIFMTAENQGLETHLYKILHRMEKANGLPLTEVKSFVTVLELQNNGPFRMEEVKSLGRDELVLSHTPFNDTEKGLKDEEESENGKEGKEGMENNYKITEIRVHNKDKNGKDIVANVRQRSACSVSKGFSLGKYNLCFSKNHNQGLKKYAEPKPVSRASFIPYANSKNKLSLPYDDASNQAKQIENLSQKMKKGIRGKDNEDYSSDTQAEDRSKRGTVTHRQITLGNRSLKRHIDLNE